MELDEKASLLHREIQELPSEPLSDSKREFAVDEAEKEPETSITKPLEHMADHLLGVQIEYKQIKT